MAQSLYTAAAGMKAQQQNIDTLANNIANINTSGFKKSRVDFGDAIYSAMQNTALPADGQTDNLQLGHGAVVAATRQIFTPGTLEQTGQSLDLALADEGFFAVENPGGTAFYTRDGTFESSVENGRNYLVTTGGDYVLDKNNQRISSEKPLDQAKIDTAGQMAIDGQVIADLGIYTFTNPDGLAAAGSKLFLATDDSGAAVIAAPDVRQGFTEGSNSELSDEMTDLITAQRAYAFLSRAITTADQMRSVQNDIRR